MAYFPIPYADLKVENYRNQENQNLGQCMEEIEQRKKARRKGLEKKRLDKKGKTVGQKGK